MTDYSTIVMFLWIVLWIHFEKTIMWFTLYILIIHNQKWMDNWLCGPIVPPHPNKEKESKTEFTQPTVYQFPIIHNLCVYTKQSQKLLPIVLLCLGLGTIGAYPPMIGVIVQCSHTHVKWRLIPCPGMPFIYMVHWKMYLFAFLIFSSYYCSYFVNR